MSLDNSSRGVTIQQESSPALIGGKTVSDSVLALSEKESSSEPTTFDLGDAGFENVVWKYTDNGSGFLIEAFYGSTKSLEVVGDIAGGILSNVSFKLTDGAWNNLFNTSYTVADSDVSLADFFGMLMVGLEGTAVALDGGQSYDLTAKLTGQSWQDVYPSGNFSNAQLVLTKVPEPATLAILSLGGLLLVRKKRQ